jgi:hypothetical protein
MKVLSLGLILLGIAFQLAAKYQFLPYSLWMFVEAFLFFRKDERLLLLLGVGLCLTGLALFARAQGRNRAWALMALLPIAGPVIASIVLIIRWEADSNRSNVATVCLLLGFTLQTALALEVTTVVHLLLMVIGLRLLDPWWLASGLCAIGLSAYAHSQGRHPAWCLMALAPITGPILGFAALKLQGETRNAKYDLGLGLSLLGIALDAGLALRFPMAFPLQSVLGLGRLPLWWLGIGLGAVGLALYAQANGHHRMWGALGVVPVAGPIIGLLLLSPLSENLISIPRLKSKTLETAKSLRAVSDRQSVLGLSLTIVGLLLELSPLPLVLLQMVREEWFVTVATNFSGSPQAASDVVNAFRKALSVFPDLNPTLVAAIGIVFEILGVGASAIGLSVYAEGQGRSKAWGTLGLAPVVGPVLGAVWLTLRAHTQDPKYYWGVGLTLFGLTANLLWPVLGVVLLSSPLSKEFLDLFQGVSPLFSFPLFFWLFVHLSVILLMALISIIGLALYAKAQGVQGAYGFMGLIAVMGQIAGLVALAPLQNGRYWGRLLTFLGVGMEVTPLLLAWVFSVLLRALELNFDFSPYLSLVMIGMGLSLALIGEVLSVVALALYAKSLGYHPAYGFMGLLMPALGPLAGLAALGLQAKMDVVPQPPISRLIRSPLAWTVLLLLLLYYVLM